MERKCLDCASQLKGRKDKKFCDDHCRSNYNNRLRAECYSSLVLVNSILRKNYAILSGVCPNGKAMLRKDELLRQGFNLNYHTHSCLTREGKTYIFCYDYGYLRLDSEVFLVVKEKKSFR